MNYPPAPMAPSAAPPPPPAPPKSNTVKWIFVGCGIVGGLGILACGGFGIFIYVTYQKYKPLLEEGDAFLKANVVVQEELGSIQKIQVDANRTSLTETTCHATLDVQGSKKRGTVVIDFVKKGDRWTSTSGKLLVDGRTIDLHPAQPPPSTKDY